MESSSKEQYKSIFVLVKSLDEQKTSINTIQQIFADEFQQKRIDLVAQCQELMLNDCETFGKKAREILWRKGYYEIITLAKRILSTIKSDKQQQYKHDLKFIENLLAEGITTFKKVVLTFENKFDLDLKDTIDLSLIKATDLEIAVYENQHHTINEISYAWDVVYAALMSIGDLYRYHIGFEFNTIQEDYVALYYVQAFKLNPLLGNAQNQLGTLYAGKNHEIDSIFHYLYALSCNVPFELSENNVNKIFQKNALFLESNEPNGSIDSETKITYFVARFILVVDIFYYDKDVTNFTDLCHSILIEIKYLLEDGDRGFLSSEVLFKMTAILIFCMHKLKLSGSKKIHSMNAVLVALASELVDNCNRSCEQFISTKEAQNIIFYDKYNRIFTKFENYARELKNANRKNRDDVPATIIQKHAEDETDPPMFAETSSDDKNSSSNKENHMENHVNEMKSKEVKEKLGSRRRRRRRQLSNCSDSASESDAPDSDVNNSDSESDVSFSSYDSDDDSDISSNWSDDDEEEKHEKVQPEKITENGEHIDSDSGDDIIVLEEEIIYPDDYDGEPIDHFKASGSVDATVGMGLVTAFENLSGIKYRKAYRKIDPNIILEFCAKEKSLKALKILFDWMFLNPDIVVGCYVSNPEFIRKIMRLVNFLNIDIFTRKIYFDRSFLTIPNMRIDLRYLFDIRRSIPVEEEEQLKRFAMFDSVQQELDWEIASKLEITANEMVFLRLFKLVDFGFHLSKMRKFHYYFCAKERVFIERAKKESTERRRDRKRRGNRSDRNKSDSGVFKKRGERRRRNRRGRDRSSRRRKERNTVIQDDEPPIEVRTIAKRYLKSKLDQNSSDESATLLDFKSKQTSENFNGKTTSEKMGELWLRNEVKNLELKMKKTKTTDVILTPYIVLDTKALADYTPVVKNLAKTKKFFILIPMAVFSELDELKKHSENARNVIKWLEQEFTRGNRFLRSQRANETLPLSLVKVPKKLDREASVFLQIVQFCNYMVTNNSENTDESDMITLLTGDNLAECKFEGFSCIGLLDAIPVKYGQIINFYSKYKKK